MENNVGDKTSPCFTTLETEKYFEKQLFHDTRDLLSSIRRMKHKGTFLSIKIANNFPKRIRSNAFDASWLRP